ncbi:Helix-turn-helix protein [Tenacibaculum sp. 190130A14a]|uniref:Helix-turn-helix protein n=1 Tax=Tenacibaculum polynesiense TaxID=3137857 RepID=A0ABM9PFC9_9FLAO
MYRYLIVFLLFTFINTGYTQNNSLDSIYLKKIALFKNTNYDSTILYSEKLESSSNICNQLSGANVKIYAFYRKKKYKEALAKIEILNAKIDSLLKKEETPCFYDHKAAIYNRLFWISKNEENYNQAYKYLLRCETYLKGHPVKDAKNYMNNLGLASSKALIKNKLNMQEEAKQILLKTFSETENPILNDLKNKNSLNLLKANVLNSLGNTYLSIANKNDNSVFLDSASYYYDKAYDVTKIFEPLHEDSEIIYSFRKTEVLIAQKQFNKAIKLINNYKNIHNGFHYKHREFFQKTLCFNGLHHSDSTIYYAYKLLFDKKDECKRSNLITTYDILSKQYDKLNKQDSALKYSQKTLEQFHLADKNKEETFHLLYKNDFEKAQKLNNSLLKKKDSNTNTLLSFLGGATILTSFLFFLFYKKEKKVKKKLIQKLKENTQEDETSKKEYNIDDTLEANILNEINRVDNNFDFIKPDFSITDIAEALHTNTTYISFVFNKTKGTTFKQYYTSLKIAYIQKKLKEEKKYRNYSIKALAEEIGYSNASAFSRAFKKHTGTTPSEYIKNLEV